MARTKLFQTSFTSGQLDENLMGRLDSPKYYQGASVIENGYCIPQGGVQKRSGLKHLGLLDLGDQEVRLIPYFFGSPTGVDQAFVIILSLGSLEVRDLQGNSVITLDTPWIKGSDIYEIDYAQSYDYLIFTHEDYPPQRLIRIQDSWNLDNLALEAIPVFAFPNAVQAPSTAYDRQTIEAQNITKGDNFKLVYNGVTSGDIQWDWIVNQPTGANQSTQDNATTLVNSVKSFLSTALGNNEFTVGVQYKYISISYGNIGGEPQLSDYRQFRSLLVNFTGVNEGKGLLISELTAKLKISPVGGGTQPPPAEEPVWSTERGWPISVTFYENRLFFGGSKSRPSTIWGSRTARYFDFSYETPAGDIVADDYIDVTINTDQVNRIQNIMSGRRLEIFTTGQEFYCPVEGVTPFNFPIVQTGGVGSRKVKPVQFDNTTLFAQRRGNAIRDFVYDFANDKYISNVTSSLATSLINEPKQMVIQQGVGTAQSDYLYLLNGNNTLSVYSSDTLNGVAAWTNFTVGGEWVSMCESAGGIYVVIKYTSPLGLPLVALAKLDDEAFLDGWVSTTTTTGNTGYQSKVTGLQHLQGEEATILEVVGGSSVLTRATVNSQGELHLNDIEAGKEVTVGLPYHFEVKSMPITLNGVQGQVVYDRKRVTRAILNVQDTADIKVTYNGRELPVRNRRLPLNPFEQNPTITGYKEIFLRGYSRDTRVGIIQDAPFNCTLISLGVEVEL